MSAKDLNLNEIRIYYPPTFPKVAYNCSRFPMFYPTFDCYYNGFMVEILDFLMKTANLTIVPIFHNNNITRDDWIEKTQEMMLNKTLDLIAVTFTKTEKRLESFEFTEPLYIPQTYVIRRAQNNFLKSVFSFFRSYDSKIWISLFFIWLIQWLFCVLNQRLTNKERFPSVFEEAWRVLRLQLLQYQNLEKTSNASSKLSISVFSFFQCYVLLGLFSSLILASILRPQISNEDPIQFFINSVHNKDYKFAVRDATYWLFDRINHSNEYPYVKLKNAIERNPLKFVHEKDELFKSVLSGESITIIQSDEHAYYYLQKYCGLEILYKDMPVIGAHLMMAKENPLMGKLSDAVKFNRLKINSIMNKYNLLVHKYNECPSENDGKFRPLKIFPYIGTSIVCGSLIIIAILLFLFEIFYYKFRKCLIF